MEENQIKDCTTVPLAACWIAWLTEELLKRPPLSPCLLVHFIRLCCTTEGQSLSGCGEQDSQSLSGCGEQDFLPANWVISSQLIVVHNFLCSATDLPIGKMPYGRIPTEKFSNCHLCGTVLVTVFLSQDGLLQCTLPVACTHFLHQAMVYHQCTVLRHT